MIFLKHNTRMQFLRRVYVRSKEKAPASWRLVHRANTVQCKFCVRSVLTCGFMLSHDRISVDGIQSLT